MSESVMDVLQVVVYNRLTSSRWPELRGIRLRAISDAPKAFLLNSESESEWDRDQWRAALCAADWITAELGGVLVGVAKSSEIPEYPGERYVEAVWVDPEYRGQGIATGLLATVEASALNEGAKAIRLAVLDGNETAWEAFRTMGFRPLPRSADAVETQMLKSLLRSEG